MGEYLVPDGPREIKPTQMQIFIFRRLEEREENEAKIEKKKDEN